MLERLKIWRGGPFVRFLEFHIGVHVLAGAALLLVLLFLIALAGVFEKTFPTGWR